MHVPRNKPLDLFFGSSSGNKKTRLGSEHRQRWILFTDGASRGNPGASAIGVVLKNPNEKIVLKEGKYIGIHTNNYAEYYAVCYGIECAKKAGGKLIEIRSDSQLLVNQMLGNYKIRDKSIKDFVFKISVISEGLDICYTHIPREKNRLADRMANEALDEEKKRCPKEPSG